MFAESIFLPDKKEKCEEKVILVLLPSILSHEDMMSGAVATVL